MAWVPLGRSPLQQRAGNWALRGLIKDLEACSEWAGSTVTKLFPPELAFFSFFTKNTAISHRTAGAHFKMPMGLRRLQTLRWTPAALQKKSKHVSKTLPPADKLDTSR